MGKYKKIKCLEDKKIKNKYIIDFRKNFGTYEELEKEQKEIYIKIKRLNEKIDKLNDLNKIDELINEYDYIDNVFAKCFRFMHLLQDTNLDDLENIRFNNNILIDILKVNIREFNLSELKLTKLINYNIDNDFVKYLFAKNIKNIKISENIKKRVLENNKFYEKYRYNNILRKHSNIIKKNQNKALLIRKEINNIAGSIKVDGLNIDEVNFSNLPYNEKERVSNEIYSKIYEVYNEKNEELGKHIINIYYEFFKLEKELKKKNLLKYMPEFFDKKLRKEIANEVFKYIEIKKNMDIVDLENKKLKRTMHNIKNVNISKTENIKKEKISKEEKIDEFFKKIKNTLKIYNDDYYKNIDDAINEKRLDLFERKNKLDKNTTIDKYILMSGNGNLSNIFTMIHEITHMIENILTNKMYFDFKIDLSSEIYAGINEALLCIDDEKLKKEFININTKAMFNFSMVILFIEKIFEYFEKNIKDDKESLNSKETKEILEYLNKEYENINKKYLPENIDIDKNLKYEWIYLTPIKNPYNLVIYLINKCISLEIAKKIKDGKIDKKEFLKSFKEKDLDPKNKYLRLKKIDIDILNKEYIKTKIKKYFDYIKLYK